MKNFYNTLTEIFRRFKDHRFSPSFLDQSNIRANSNHNLNNHKCKQYISRKLNTSFNINHNLNFSLSLKLKLSNLNKFNIYRIKILKLILKFHNTHPSSQLNRTNRLIAFLNNHQRTTQILFNIKIFNISSLFNSNKCNKTYKHQIIINLYLSRDNKAN